MDMIDEQRFRARMTALDAAVHMVTGGGRNLVNSSDFVTQIADQFENWIMRPAIDITRSDWDKPTVPARQPCGAFERPPWFEGRRWYTCSGQHRESDGWHIDGSREAELIFHSHHAPDHAGPQRCACGSTALPCPDGRSKDMRT